MSDTSTLNLGNGIQNIIKKISDDAAEKAAQILKSAQLAADSEKQRIISEANAEKERILAEAEVLAARAKEQIMAANNLDIRNQKLAAKQEMMEKVFAEALKRLEALGQAEFETFVKNSCKGADIKEGDVIMLPESRKGMDVKKIHPGLSPYSGSRSITGGFILISGGIEQNNTFKALLDFKKSDMERDVAAKLF